MGNTINTQYATESAYKNVQGTSADESEKADANFSDMMAEKHYPSTKDMSLTEYKLYILDRIRMLDSHPSQRKVNWFIDITDAAYQRMQANPAYEQQVMDFLAQKKAINFGGCTPQFAFIHVGDTMEDCRAYTYGIRSDSPAGRAIERRRIAAERAKKERRKKLLKEYLKKRAEAKRLQEKFLNSLLAKQRLERARLDKQWDEKQQDKKQQNHKASVALEAEKQRQRAFTAYEANLVMMIRHEDQLLL